MTTKTFFVTASGTEIGKTYVTTGLIRALRRKGHAVDALKPLITDFTDETQPGSDTVLILEALGRDPTPEAVERTSPWRYLAALAPDMASPYPPDHRNGRGENAGRDSPRRGEQLPLIRCVNWRPE